MAKKKLIVKTPDYKALTLFYNKQAGYVIIQVLIFASGLNF